MADPFEVRMRFSSQLGQLNASVVSLQKAATYALKYKDMDEDLHSCILEQVERVSRLEYVRAICTNSTQQNNMNTRANIMFFIEHFLDMAAKEGHMNYIKMIQRDIIRIVDAVAPDNGSGAANVKVARLVCTAQPSPVHYRRGSPADREQVLQGLQRKGFLDAQAVTEIEEVLKERETSAHDAGLSSPAHDDTEGGDMPPSQAIPKPGRASAPRLDKRHVEQRIEEDRERHKRVRESVWAIRDCEDEISRLWDETSDLGEDDHVMGREEFLAREAAIGQQCAHYAPRTLDDLYDRNGQKVNGRSH